MAKALVTDELWEAIEPLLPEEPPKPKGGRPRIDNRATLSGIVFVLKKSGIPWEMLPKEMGCGSGMTCWRRLREWEEAGVWSELHRVMLDRLGQAGGIDWERACLDSASVAAPGGVKRAARTPPTRARRAPSVISWTLAAERPPLGDPHGRQLSTARKSWRKPWTPWLRSLVLVADPAGHASVPKSCTPIRATTTRAAGRR